MVTKDNRKHIIVADAPKKQNGNDFHQIEKWYREKLRDIFQMQYVQDWIPSHRPRNNTVLITSYSRKDLANMGFIKNVVSFSEAIKGVKSNVQDHK